MINRADRISGVVLGTAIGDALGYPVEFIGVDEIKRRYGRVESFVGWDERGQALYSDDTQMFIAVSEGLLRAGDQQNLEVAAWGVREELVRWLNDPQNNRAPGGACILGCSNLAMGMDWRVAGKPGGGGCGAAMRSMAYGIWCQDPAQAAQWAGEMALMTHRLPMGQASAAAVAAIVAALLEGAEPVEAVIRGVEAAERYDQSTADMIQEAAVWARTAREVANPEEALASALDRWRGWSGHEAVAASVFCFLLHHEDFSEAVLSAVNSPGDSDSLGAITGAFSGAYLGAEAIPEKWANHIENSSYLRDLAQRLYRL